jgi:hypothetical protein
MTKVGIMTLLAIWDMLDRKDVRLCRKSLEGIRRTDLICSNITEARIRIGLRPATRIV